MQSAWPAVAASRAHALLSRSTLSIANMHIFGGGDRIQKLGSQNVGR
jgi:hypothetical protein